MPDEFAGDLSLGRRQLYALRSRDGSYSDFNWEISTAS